MDKPEIDALVDAARQQILALGGEDVIEVDDVSEADQREAFSEGEEGTWVRAWVFIPKDGPS